jgi:hypothetical protein
VHRSAQDRPPEHQACDPISLVAGLLQGSLVRLPGTESLGEAAGIPAGRPGPTCCRDASP